MFARFGPEPRMQLYDRGIRRRLAPMLGDRAQLELAYSLLFALPGTPVIRYGDEIGMGDDLALKEREAVRTPMQWSNEPQGGFSTAEKTVRPVITRGRTVTRRSMSRRSGAMRFASQLDGAMIRLRKECPEIGWGEWTLVKDERARRARAALRMEGQRPRLAPQLLAPSRTRCGCA